MAEKLHIGVADYSKIETGLLKPRDAVFEKMIALFNLAGNSSALDLTISLRIG